MSHQFQQARIGSLAAPEGQTVVHQAARVALDQGAVQTMAGNGETVSGTGPLRRVDAGGASRTGVIMPAPAQEGDQIVVVNVSNAAEDLTMAAAGTSNVAGGTGVAISQFECAHFIAARDVAGALLWYGVQGPL